MKMVYFEEIKLIQMRFYKVLPHLKVKICPLFLSNKLQIIKKFQIKWFKEKNTHSVLKTNSRKDDGVLQT
jgi:hypothetical protein